MRWLIAVDSCLFVFFFLLQELENHAFYFNSPTSAFNPFMTWQSVLNLELGWSQLTISQSSCKYGTRLVSTRFVELSINRIGSNLEICETCLLLFLISRNLQLVVGWLFMLGHLQLVVGWSFMLAIFIGCFILYLACICNLKSFMWLKMIGSCYQVGTL